MCVCHTRAPAKAIRRMRRHLYSTLVLYWTGARSPTRRGDLGWEPPVHSDVASPHYSDPCYYYYYEITAVCIKVRHRETLDIGRTF